MGLQSMPDRDPWFYYGNADRKISGKKRGYDEESGIVSRSEAGFS